MTEIDTRTPGSSASDDEQADYVASYQRLLDTDTHPVPQVLREETHDLYEDQNFIPVSRYISRKYHELERDRMW